MGRPWVTHLKMGNPWVPIGYIANISSQTKCSATRSISPESLSISALIPINIFLILKTLLDLLRVFWKVSNPNVLPMFPRNIQVFWIQIVWAVILGWPSKFKYWDFSSHVNICGIRSIGPLLGHLLDTRLDTRKRIRVNATIVTVLY